ncbi:MAG: DUF3082 domain-containing protein [Cyanobacteria bacterium K_DeepCast_35m_m2_155]|nr:DUF3082 domain-containing protein [Cyanobacteria bacterium K_DeepCast_35m_m2_155]
MSDSTAADTPKRKGPLSFLSGALTAGLLAWLSYGLSLRMVQYYALHPPHYSARMAQSIATALETLIVGIAFLATFSFGFIGLGLSLVFVRSLLPQAMPSPAGSEATAEPPAGSAEAD